MNGIVAVVRIDLTDKQVICIHYTQFIHSRNEELCATSLREEYLYKVFGTFPHERVIFSLPCLYLFSHLWLKGIMDFFFVYRRLWSNTNCSSFGHRELFQFSPISCVSIFVIFFFFGSTSLLFGTIIYSKPHLYILCPSPRITNFFPGSPSSCCWRTLLATKFWGIGIRVATWISLLLGPLNWQRKEIICDPCMYSYLYSLYIATRNIHWAKAKHEFISMPATLM